MRYRAEATRIGDWWAVELPEVADGRIHTQARRIEQVPDAAAAAITAWFADEDGRHVRGTEIDVAMTVPEPLRTMFDTARRARQDAEQAAADQRAATIAAIEAAAAAGLSMRDIGALLGVSHQYVARLHTAA